MDNVNVTKITLKPSVPRLRLHIKEEMEKWYRWVPEDDRVTPPPVREVFTERPEVADCVRAQANLDRLPRAGAGAPDRMVLALAFAAGMAVATLAWLIGLHLSAAAHADDWDETYGASLVPVCEPFDPGHPGYEE